MIVLLVVESRPKIWTEYVKWLVKQKNILFWEEDKAPIWYMRRKLIERALETDCSHVLFVDTDVVPPKDFIKKLLAHNKDIVSGAYHLFTGTPCSRKNGEFYQGEGLEEVDMCSIGASLIKREVLEKIEYPEPDDHTMDADYEFCKKAKKQGFKVYQDFDLNCLHIQIVPVVKGEYKKQ